MEDKMDTSKGILFDNAYQKLLKSCFCYPDADPDLGSRLFFENSGGSLRLKRAVEVKAAVEEFPDCPERTHERALILQRYLNEGKKEILELVFGAKKGALLTELSASQCMFHIVSVILENCGFGTNAVTSSLEHPSAYDAVRYYCEKTGREFRTVPSNPKTGGIDPIEVEKYVDKDTCLLSIMAASNISGNIMDIKEIVRRARAINPDIYVITDAVQHAPHCLLDVDDLQVDGSNFAPYKFFGVRGCGFGYVSERVAKMRHRKLYGKAEDEWGLGTPTPGNFAAMLAVIDYVCSIGKHFIDTEDRKVLYSEGMRRIHLQERALLYRMLEGTDRTPGLRHIPGVEVYVDIDDLTQKDLIVAMGIRGMDFIDCRNEYQRRGVTVYERVRSSLYSKRIVESLGLEGAMRVSPLHCHGKEDIDKFLRITADMAKEYAK